MLQPQQGDGVWANSRHRSSVACGALGLMHVHADARPARTQVETGSAITWKYPSVVLVGQDSVGEFYSVALTNNRQQVRDAAPCPALLGRWCL